MARQLLPQDLRAALLTVDADMSHDPSYMLPCSLVSASHPVLDKANAIVADEASVRERIVVLADRHVLKVKTGDHRGALWQDEQGTWWLLAAGHRKDDTGGDFYQEMRRYSDSTNPIAPTEADLRYQRLETAFESECERERAAHADLLRTVMTAARELGESVTAEIFGAPTTVRLVPDENGLALLELSWDLLEFDQQDRFPMDVLAMVPGLESIDLWDYSPPPRNQQSPQTWYAYVTESWVQHMATSAELDELLTNRDDWRPVNPSTDGSENFSHWAKGSIVTLAYVTGIEITGLCGSSVIAHRDYERLPVCASCNENLNLLRSLG